MLGKMHPHLSRAKFHLPLLTSLWMMSLLFKHFCPKSHNTSPCRGVSLQWQGRAINSSPVSGPVQGIQLAWEESDSGTPSSLTGLFQRSYANDARHHSHLRNGLPSYLQHFIGFKRLINFDIKLTHPCTYQVPSET